MRTPGAVPNLCKADSGLSAMIGILVAISSHLVARYKILSCTCSCPIALRLCERRTKEQELLALPPSESLGCFWRGGAWPGGPGVGARCGNGLFSTYKSPKFYLSFTILVSFILVKYPDRIGLVNTVEGRLTTGLS